MRDHDIHVLVADGRKALLFRNMGERGSPRLTTVRTFANAHTERNRERGVERPGRLQQHGDSRRSAIEPADWHAIEETKFLGGVADALGRLSGGDGIAKLVVVAPPRALAALRSSFSKGLRGRVVAEIDKDFTHHPAYEIERLLGEHLN